MIKMFNFYGLKQPMWAVNFNNKHVSVLLCGHVEAVTWAWCVFQVYMACQSMLMVLVGYTPEHQTEQHNGVPSSQQELQQHFTFTEDAESIVTEVRPRFPTAVCRLVWASDKTWRQQLKHKLS